MILCKTLLAGLLSLPLSAAFAHGGEDHGAPPALPASTLNMPSTEANSLDFELFAQLNGDTLTVYLDHFADNQPVSKAIIEVESAAFKASLHEVAPGTYQAPAAALNSPGEHSLLFTVAAGEQSDFLDAVLNVSAAEHADHAAPLSPRWWWLGGGLLALVGGGLLLKSRLSNRSTKHGAAA